MLLLIIGSGAGFILVYFVPVNDYHGKLGEKTNQSSKIRSSSESGESGVVEPNAELGENSQKSGLSGFTPGDSSIDIFADLPNSDDFAERVASRAAYHLTSEDIAAKHWKVPVNTIENLKQELAPILENWAKLEKQYSGAPVFFDSAVPNQYSFEIPLFPPPLKFSEEIRLAIFHQLSEVAAKDALTEDVGKATAFVMSKLGVTPLPRVLSGEIRSDGISAILSVLESPEDFHLESHGGSSIRPVQMTLLTEGDPRILAGGRYHHLLPTLPDQQ